MVKIQVFNNTQKTFRFKKVFKLKIKNLKFTKLRFGIYGLRALQSTRLLPNQMETLRRIFVRTTLRLGKIWLYTKINYLLSKKSSGARMGKGIGNMSSWVIEIKLGQIIIEFSMVLDIDIKSMLLKMANKMPITVDFVFKELKY